MTARRFIESARVRSTGDAVRVVRRLSIPHDMEVWASLESSGAFVKGAPGGAIDYRRPGASGFARLSSSAVLVLNADGSCEHILDGAYFQAHYVLDAAGGDC